MIELRNVHFSYGDGFALKDITLAVEKGSFNLLVGANGSGKTTLLKILAGLLPIRSGTIIIDGRIATYADLREFCCYVLHNPFEQIVGSTVEEDLAFGLENLGLRREEIRENMEAALKMFQLSEVRHANPFILSGGLAQKLVIASLYLLKPEIFLLDEPTSMLDDPGVEELLQALRELKQLGKTIFVSTHEPKIFFGLATSVIHMSDGTIDFHGGIHEFLERRFEDVEC